MKADTLSNLNKYDNLLMEGKLVIFLLRDFKAAFICFAFGLPLFIATSWALEKFGFNSTLVFWLSTVVFVLLSTLFYSYLIDSNFLLPSSISKFDKGKIDTKEIILECPSDFFLKGNDLEEINPTFNKLDSTNFSPQDMAHFHIKVGSEKMKVGLYEDAILEFDLALQQDNSLKDLVFQCQGHAFLMLQKYCEAITYFSKAIASNHLSHLAFNKRGYAYARLGKLDLAIKDFQSALLIKPDYKEARHNLDVAFGATSSNKKEANL